MSNKPHSITSLPADAPTAKEEVAEQVEAKVGKMKTFVHKNKRFFIGVGTGLGVATAALFLAKARADEEDEVIEGTFVPTSDPE